MVSSIELLNTGYNGWNILTECMTAACPNKYRIVTSKEGEVRNVCRSVGVTSCSLLALDREQTIFRLILLKRDDDDDDNDVF